MLFTSYLATLAAKKSKEQFVDDGKNKKDDDGDHRGDHEESVNIVVDVPKGAGKVVAGLVLFMAAVFVIELALGVWAAVLSFKSNRLINWGIGWSILFAVFAFFANLNYLVIHLINKLDLIHTVRAPRFQQAPPPPPFNQSGGGSKRLRAR